MEVAISGFLDDYAFLIWGLVEVYRSSNIKKYLDQAVELTETVLEHFSDAKGGFYQTEDSSEEMIVRLKEVYDGAIPSGNSVMAMNLVTLGIITGDDRYMVAAQSLFEAFSMELRRNPAAYAHSPLHMRIQRGEPDTDYRRQGFADRCLGILGGCGKKNQHLSAQTVRFANLDR